MSKFLNTFGGRFVAILTNKSNEVSSSSKDETLSTEIPVSLGGYVIDEDMSFLYIGHTEDEVSLAINKSTIVLIELADDEDDVTGFIDLYDDEDPEDPKNYN